MQSTTGLVSVYPSVGRKPRNLFRPCLETMRMAPFRLERIRYGWCHALQRVQGQFRLVHDDSGNLNCFFFILFFFLTRYTHSMPFHSLLFICLFSFKFYFFIFLFFMCNTWTLFFACTEMIGAFKITMKIVYTTPFYVFKEISTIEIIKLNKMRTLSISFKWAFKFCDRGN